MGGGAWLFFCSPRENSQVVISHILNLFLSILSQMEQIIYSLYSKKYNLHSPVYITSLKLSKLHDLKLQQCHYSKYWVIFK